MVVDRKGGYMSGRTGTHEITKVMSPALRSYHRRKQNVIDEGKKSRDDSKNDFLFDDKLHEKMSKYVLGYNPYQE